MTDGPIITEEQGQRLLAALHTWSSVYTQEKGKPPEWSYVNITKSCLLGRLIYEGKEPLPVPPPRFFSAPWYSLIENGRDHIHSRFTMWRDEHRSPRHIVIGQDDGWSLVKERPDGALVVEYPRNGRWLVRAMGPADDPVVGGHSIVDEDGNKLPPGEKRAIYFDTVIERIDDDG